MIFSGAFEAPEEHKSQEPEGEAEGEGALVFLFDGAAGDVGLEALLGRCWGRLCWRKNPSVSGHCAGDRFQSVQATSAGATGARESVGSIVVGVWSTSSTGSTADVDCS
jgi:hypothetical protein